MAEKITRLQAALARSGLTKPDGPFDDEQMRITCPICNTEQSLVEAQASADGQETYYRCKNGCQNLVIVVDLTNPVRAKTMSGGRGYFIGNVYVIKNGADILIPVGASGIKLPPTDDFPADPRGASQQ